MADPLHKALGRLFSVLGAAQGGRDAVVPRQSSCYHHQINPAKHPVICCMSVQPRLLCHPRLQQRTWLLVIAFGHSNHGRSWLHQATLPLWCLTVSGTIGEERRKSVDAASSDGLRRRRLTEKRSRPHRRRCHKILAVRVSFLEPQPREWSSATSPSGVRGLRVIGKVTGRGRMDIAREAGALIRSDRLDSNLRLRAGAEEQSSVRQATAACISPKHSTRSRSSPSLPGNHVNTAVSNVQAPLKGMAKPKMVELVVVST
ncbi:hypothetical protein SVAN01_00302 [Stagonosporopsis vannaccii]|nr:hypothetical protein SVAN01_00302 [Stagonosporopsis vannaccii]